MEATNGASESGGWLQQSGKIQVPPPNGEFETSHGCALQRCCRHVSRLLAQNSSHKGILATSGPYQTWLYPEAELMEGADDEHDLLASFWIMMNLALGLVGIREMGMLPEDYLLFDHLPLNDRQTYNIRKTMAVIYLSDPNYNKKNEFLEKQSFETLRQKNVLPPKLEKFYNERYVHHENLSFGICLFHAFIKDRNYPLPRLRLGKEFE